MVHEIDDVTVLGESEHAILIESEETGREWVPKTQVARDSEAARPGDEGTLRVTSWIARAKGWRP